MKAQTLATVVNRLYELEQERDKYLESLPADIRDSFFDNEYTNIMGMQYDIVLQALFGPVMVEDVYWFLLEWKPGYSVTVDGKEYTIQNVDQFIAYMVEIYALE